MNENSRYVEGVWPPRLKSPDWREPREEAQAERRRAKKKIVDKEAQHKSMARKRDGWVCRFPRCSCHALRTAPEVAHVDGDKGMGGDHGNLSRVHQLMCLCPNRHKVHSRISLHSGTLRIEFLSAAKANGPVRWWVDVAKIADPHTREADWQCVAEESQPRVLKPLTHEQGEWLRRIAELAA